MIIILATFLILFAYKHHICGWTHFEQKGARRLYLIAAHGDVTFSINGCSTGLAGCGLLHLSAELKAFRVDFLRNGKVYASHWIASGEECVWVMAPTPSSQEMPRLTLCGQSSYRSERA